MKYSYLLIEPLYPDPVYFKIYDKSVFQTGNTSTAGCVGTDTFSFRHYLNGGEQTEAEAVIYLDLS